MPLIRNPLGGTTLRREESAGKSQSVKTEEGKRAVAKRKFPGEGAKDKSTPKIVASCKKDVKRRVRSTHCGKEKKWQKNLRKGRIQCWGGQKRWFSRGRIAVGIGVIRKIQERYKKAEEH